MKIIWVIFSMAALYGCSWSETKRKAFEESCKKETKFSKSTISFVGFDFEELKTIEIVETKGSEVVQESMLDISTVHYRYNPGSKAFNVEIPIDWYHVNHEYEFIISGGDSYSLHDMNMVMTPAYSMYSEHHFCSMKKYSIDEQVFEDFEIQINKRAEF